IDSKNNLLVRDKSSEESAKTIALIGVEDFAIVDTEDALLVMPKSQAQKVKKASGLAKKA
ncbi:MAG: mannose-1-phosphate guanylyltransferase, partial [Parascardovia denticolens]